MITTRIAATVAALVLGAAVAVPASAASYPKGVDYRGTFDGAVTFVGFGSQDSKCFDAGNNPVTPPTDQVLSGTWRANVGANVVSARFVMLLNDVPHVIYTAPMTREDTTATFEATIPTGAGPLTIALNGTQFTYTIAPYDTTAFFPDGLRCEAAIFHGTLS